jgi:toxin CptA
MDYFYFSPSKCLTKCLITAHFLALFASFANALPILVQTLLVVILVLHGYWLLSSSCPWHRFRYSEALGWEMAGSDSFATVRILPSTVITTFALFLHVEIVDCNTHIKCSSVFDAIRQKNRQALLLLPDSLDEDGYRSLVVKIKTTYKIKSKSANLLIESV